MAPEQGPFCFHSPFRQNADLGVRLGQIAMSVGLIPQCQVVAGHQGDDQLAALRMVPNLDLDPSGDQLLAGNLLLWRPKSSLVHGSQRLLLLRMPVAIQLLTIARNICKFRYGIV